MQPVINNALFLKNNIQLSIQRLVTIWALSEATLGGVLHALKIPLTGIFINGTAVIIIVLIAFFADKIRRPSLNSISGFQSSLFLILLQFIAYLRSCPGRSLI